MDLNLFLVGLGLFTGFFLITLLFWIRERKTGRRVYYIKTATALGTLTGIANMMKAGPEIDIFGLGPNLLQWFVLTSWSIVFAILGFFFLSMRHESPPWHYMSVAIALVVTQLVTGLVTISNPVAEGNLSYLVWKVCFSLLGMYIFGYGAKVFFAAQQKRPEFRSLLLSVALLVIAVSYIPVIFTYDLPNYLGIQVFQGINTESATDMIRIAMIGIIVIALLTDLEYFYRIPTELYNVSIVATSGVNLFSYGNEDVDIEPNLLASALTAISIVIKESSGSIKELAKIETGDRVILIENKPEQEFAVTALVDRSSLLLIRSLKTFADMISKEIGAMKGTDMEMGFDEERINKLLYQAFPFLK